MTMNVKKENKSEKFKKEKIKVQNVNKLSGIVSLANCRT